MLSVNTSLAPGSTIGASAFEGYDASSYIGGRRFHSWEDPLGFYLADIVVGVKADEESLSPA